MIKPAKAFAVPALLAAFALSAAPAAATDLPPIHSDIPVQTGIQTADYGGGWGGRHRYRHRGRTSAGDVLGAVIVLGTIAAVANAATRAQRQRGYPYPDSYPRYPDRRGDYRSDYRPSGPQGVEGAADLCLREIERDARVEDVTEVQRNASGWLVTGEMADGAGFACSIGADGRIERIEIGGRAQLPRDSEARSEGGGERYYGAEVEAEAQAASGPQPEYPGGPLPGDPLEDDAPEDDPAG